jgi:hypothetical protein
MPIRKAGGKMLKILTLLSCLPLAACVNAPKKVEVKRAVATISIDEDLGIVEDSDCSASKVHLQKALIKNEEGKRRLELTVGVDIFTKIFSVRRDGQSGDDSAAWKGDVRWSAVTANFISQAPATANSTNDLYIYKIVDVRSDASEVSDLKLTVNKHNAITNSDQDFFCSFKLHKR